MEEGVEILRSHLSHLLWNTVPARLREARKKHIGPLGLNRKIVLKKLPWPYLTFGEIKIKGGR